MEDEYKFVLVFNNFRNVISVGNQVANVQPQHAPDEVLQEQCHQTASSTQILILLPDGNQQLVNVSVPQGSCSLKEILEQVRPSEMVQMTCIWEMPSSHLGYGQLCD